MSLWSALLLASNLFAQGSMYSQEDESFDLTNFTDCGLITRYASNKINPNCFTQLRNARLDEDLTILRRNGSAKYNATPCADSKSVRGLWPFYATDGTKYMVINSSQSFFYTSGSGDCTAIPGLNSLSATADWECSQLAGKLWCVNGTDSPFSWNGASTQAISGMPNSTLIGTFRNRLVLGNISGGLTRIRLSGELDGTDWTVQIPGRSTTPANIDIAGTNDGNQVKCLLGQYQDAFWIGRDRDLFALYGNDRRDFTLRKMSNEIGCIEPRSVQEKNNTLLWLSRRGVERLSGTSITRASDPIRPDIDVVIAAGGNTQSKTFSSQSEFEGGSANLQASGPGAPMSTTILAGSVVPSSWTVVESTTQFYQGTIVNLSTINETGRLTLIQGATASFINAGGESSDFTNWPLDGSPNWSNISDSSMYGSRAFQRGSLTCPVFLDIVVESGGPNWCATGSITISDGLSISSYTCDLSNATNSMVRVTVSGGKSILNSMRSSFFIRGTALVIKYKDGDATAGNCAVTFDIDESNMVTTGTYVTQKWNTSFSTPTYGNFDADLTSSTALSNSILFQSRTSSSTTVPFDAAVIATPDQQIFSAGKQFIIIESSFSINTTTNTPPSLASIGLEAATTGYYITDCANPGTQITGWGNLRSNYQILGGSVSFWISSGTSCNEVTRTTANWITQPINSAIVIPTSTYSAARIRFWVDHPTQTVALNDITWEWNIGGLRPPVASAVYRDRYHLFYTSNTESGSHNDKALVLDQNDVWVGPDDMNAYSATIYNNKLYTGDSTNTGTVYQQNTGHDDYGNNFTFSFATPDLDFGTPHQLKTYKQLYAVLKSETDQSQDIDINFSYQIDGSTTSYSLGSCNLDEAAESGLFTCKIPFPLDSPVDGHWIKLLASNTGAQGPVRVYSLKLIYSRKEID